MNKVELTPAHCDAIRGPPADTHNKTEAWRMRCLDRGKKERPRSEHMPDTTATATNGNCKLG